MTEQKFNPSAIWAQQSPQTFLQLNPSLLMDHIRLTQQFECQPALISTLLAFFFSDFITAQKFDLKGYF